MLRVIHGQKALFFYGPFGWNPAANGYLHSLKLFLNDFKQAMF